MRPILMAALAIGLTGMAAIAQPYELKNTFTPGETLYLDLTTSMQGAMHSEVAQMPIEATNEGVIAFETRAAQPDGSGEVMVELKQLFMIAPTLGVREPLDFLPIADEEGKQFSITIRPDGEVVETDSASMSMIQGVQGVSQSPIQMRPYPKLPEGPVNIGHTWSEKWVVPYLDGSKPIIEEAEYRLAKVEERDGVNVAIIEVKTTINAEDVSFEPGQMQGAAGQSAIEVKLSYETYVKEGSGEMVFDLDRGRLLSMNDDLRLNLKMGGETSLGGASFPTDFTMIVRVRNHAVYQDAMPE